MAMKDRRQELEEIIDRDGTIGYMIVVGGCGFIIFCFFALIYLSIKGVNVFG